MTELEQAASARQPIGRARPGWSPTSQRALIRIIFPGRHATIVALGFALPFVASLGDSRWLLSALAFCILLPIDHLFARQARHRGEFNLLMPAVNQVLASVVVLLSPGALAGVGVVIAGDNALSALIFGQRRSLMVTTAGTALLFGASMAVETEQAGPILVALAISNVAGSWIIGNVGEWERQAGVRFEELVSKVDVIVWESVPGSSVYTYVSNGVAAFGYAIDDWYEPRFWVEHIHPDDVARVLHEARTAISGDRTEHTMEYRFLDAQGQPIHVRDVASIERDSDGRALLMRGVIVDVTDKLQAEELLRQQATHDSLTGLPNRALLADHLEQALKEARRTGDRVALLLLDLDDFKEVNDALGHHAGDRLLVAFAERLRRELRECDTIARLGGDEFALLLTTNADVEGAAKVAERVLEVIDEPFDVEGLALQARTSIGIAVFPDHAEDAESLSARADVAMYLAKGAGKGAAVYSPELDRSSIRRLSLLGHLRDAIADDQLSLSFQPCFDLRSGQVVSVEALVRWEHPQYGEIGPDEFIRLAEMSGLIEPLSRRVISKAVEVLTHEDLAVKVSANLSVRNLSEPDLVPWLTELAREHGLKPGQLVLEVTETEVMEDIQAASAVLAQIAQLGIGLAIDDFGAGQSALAYLRLLPVEELKIDRLLVAGVGSSAGSYTICSSLVDLAHDLGLRVVAEGATDDRDVAALRRMGCDRVQGFVLGHPTPLEQLAALCSLTIDEALAASSASSPEGAPQ